jgi:energy-coupling factor transporter transmembrane protein EcfT|tara:strand:- start:50 stop:496 length:447 start_codon:yes stop_codon:yes gene_type:complete
MDLTQIIIIIISIAAAWIVFKLITKFIFKIVLPILILLIGVYFAYQYYGPGDLIKSITELYCEGDNIDQVKCECFVEPIISDLESRLSLEEMLELKNNPLKSTEEFHTSYKNKKDVINSCFQEKGESGNLGEDILKDIKKLFYDFGIN